MAAPAAVVWHPTSPGERYRTLDILRGFALFGVLLVNLESGFRVSLFTHILHLHTDAGWMNRWADFFVRGCWEFKAWTLFSILFGTGAAMQAERATARGVSVGAFLTRRYVALLGLGLIHLFLIWNGDILTLYGICGLLLIPLLRLPPRWLAAATAVGIALPYLIPVPSSFLHAERWPEQAQLATRVYQTGSFLAILRFRMQEAWEYIVPLLLSVLPRTWGMMMLGALAWRLFPLRPAGQWRPPLWWLLIFCGTVGAAATALELSAKETDQAWPFAGWLTDFDTNVFLAVAYAAAILLWPRTLRVIAPLGQMALTNYLVQSVVLGLLFYGYGFGWFGRLGSAACVLIAVVLYAAQVVASRWWLRRHRFGPVEWLWRRLTYGPAVGHGERAIRVYSEYSN